MVSTAIMPSCSLPVDTPDISDGLKTLFTEEYTYQKDPDDGEFYCKIRQYQGCYGEANPYFERIWLGRLSALSKNRRDLLDQLFRHKKYADAFDALLHIPALFCGFRLTVVHQVIAMRCEEVFYSARRISQKLIFAASYTLFKTHFQCMERDLQWRHPDYATH